MEMPAELRRQPPRPTLDWVARSIGPAARVVGVRRLRNAWAAAVHAIDVDDGAHDAPRRHELVLRRWVRTDLPPEPGVVENEAAALALLAEVAALTTPALVACDPDGTFADAPALVMTRLPGRDVLAPPDLDVYLDGLVTALRTLHAIPTPPAGLPEYRPWGLDGLDDRPPWVRRADVWTRAVELARRSLPAFAGVVCHRDFHPGNVLWHLDRVSGVVDWTHACIGPAAADVAHCRLNLTVLFGIDVADEFARRYGPVEHLAWFDVVDVVSWGTLDAWRWRDAGRHDITDETLASAVDTFLRTAVDRS